MPSPSRSSGDVAESGSGSEPSTSPSPSLSRSSGPVPAASSPPSETPSRSVSGMDGFVWCRSTSSGVAMPSSSGSGSAGSNAPKAVQRSENLGEFVTTAQSGVVRTFVPSRL